MMTLFPIAVLWCAGFLSDADSSKATAKTHLQRFQGVWVVSALTSDGIKVPIEELHSKIPLEMIFTHNKYVTKVGKKILGKGEITINSSTKPKQIEQKSTAPADKGRLSYGIYKFDDGQLIMCFSEDEKERPKAFTSKRGSKHQLMVLRKIKPDRE